MQITELRNEGLKKEFNIIIAANDVTQEIEKKVQQISKGAKIQGFRPGKIPSSVIKQRYNQTIMSNTLEELIKQSSDKLLKERNLKPAVKPNIEVVKFKENEDLEFKMSLEIFPEVTIPEFSNIKLQKVVCELTDNDITEALEKIANSNKEFVKSDKPKAEKGDAVVIDFEGRINGELIEGGTGNDYRLELGQGQFIEGFEDQLIGSKAGDKVLVKVKFPDNYGAQKLAGQPAEFDVIVKEILVAKPVEINDEFAKKYGLNNLDELKSKINEQMQKDTEQATNAKVRKELFDELEKICNFPVPEGMVEAEFNILWERAVELKKENPAFSNTSDEELKETYKKMSKRRVVLGILLSEVAKENNVDVSQDEIRQAIYDQARSYPGQEHAVLDYYRTHPHAIEHLKGPIMEDKAVNIILEKVQTSEKKVPFKDFPEQVKISEETI